MIKAIGVVVPAHNEVDWLPACLAALRAATRAVRPLPVHLVVVADSCRDQTAAVARQAGVAAVEITARNVGAARAAGFHEVLRRVQHHEPTEVWLATTDADTIVTPCWLDRQIRYAEAGWDAVAGTVEVVDWSAYRDDVPVLFAERYGTGEGPHSHVHGANLGFRGHPTASLPT